MTELSLKYGELYESYLKDIASLLCSHLSKHLDNIPHIDSVSARAKSPDRFLSKAKKEDEDGNKKYLDPLIEIQDQIGARINVFYLSDVETVKTEIEKYFTAIEVQPKSPDRDDAFGYFGEHFVLKIPDDALPDEVQLKNKDTVLPEVFELQIKTLFQHAWSEAHHDLGYKSVRKLTPNECRKVAFSAAQAWGADQIFQELSLELAPQAHNDVS